jgi:MFS family permease
MLSSGFAKHFAPGLSCLNVWRAPLHPLRRAKARPNRLNRWRQAGEHPRSSSSAGLIAAVAFGPRSALGFFLTPLSSANHWGRHVFAFALAVQNLLWGAAQPVAGAIADRFGAVRVLSAGAILYALGLVLMAHSSNAAMLDLSPVR